MPSPNDKIGPYTLIRKLGRGSFGVVWLAEKRGQILTTEVALKLFLDEEFNLDPIKKEAAVWLGAGGHPNILKFIDADVYENQPVIVSEYASDGTLTDWLNRQGGKAPSLGSAIAMLDGILAGLEHLHSKGIVHRDLKPDNILLQGATPRLADFGIARLLENTGAYSTRSFGTPKYMAPEAFRGKRSEQTDIWSTGVILYQMLTASWPFDGDDIVSIMHAIVSDNPKPLPAGYPNELKILVEKSLQKNLDLRYRSASEMRRAVQHLAHSGLPITLSEPDLPLDPTLRNVPENTQSAETDALESQPIRRLKLDYWNKLEELLGQTNSVVVLESPKAYHTLTGPLGYPQVKLFARATSRTNQISVGIQIFNRRDIYQHLHNNRASIEAELRRINILESVDWKEAKEFQPTSQITISNYQANIILRPQWDEYLEWHRKTLEGFYKTFEPRIRAAVRASSTTVSVVTSTKELVEAFWEGFELKRARTKSSIQLGKSVISSTGKGKSYRCKTISHGFRLAAQINPNESDADVNITVGSAQFDSFEALRASQPIIDQKIPGLVWNSNPVGESWVLLRRDFVVSNREDWEATYDWLLDNLQLFKEVFSIFLQKTVLNESSTLEEPSPVPSVNVRRLLEQIGMTAFITHYEQFRDLTLSSSELVDLLPRTYTLNSRRTRISRARKIFLENLEPQALKIISEAEGVDPETRKRAVSLRSQLPDLKNFRPTDEKALKAVMVDASQRRFWIVLWGDPTHSPDEDEQVFDGSAYDQGFPVNPVGLRIGDICFVHRIHISKIIYVAEVVDQPRKSTSVEAERDDWRKKWTWSVTTRNLTPNYGSHWRSRGRKTFELLRLYNELNSEQPAKISALKFGRHVRISQEFAEFLIGQILASNEQSC